MGQQPKGSLNDIQNKPMFTFWTNTCVKSTFHVTVFVSLVINSFCTVLISCPNLMFLIEKVCTVCIFSVYEKKGNFVTRVSHKISSFSFLDNLYFFSFFYCLWSIKMKPYTSDITFAESQSKGRCTIQWYISLASFFSFFLVTFLVSIVSFKSFRLYR